MHIFSLQISSTKDISFIVLLIYLNQKEKLSSKFLFQPNVWWCFPVGICLNKRCKVVRIPSGQKCVHLIFGRLSFGARREKSSRTGNKAQRDLFGARAFAAAGWKVGEFCLGPVCVCAAAAESGANGHTTLEVWSQRSGSNLNTFVYGHHKLRPGNCQLQAMPKVVLQQF